MGLKMLIVFVVVLGMIVANPAGTKYKEQNTVVSAVINNSPKDENNTVVPVIATTEIVKLKETPTKEAMVNVPVDFANAFLPMVKYFYKMIGLTNQIAASKTKDVSRYDCDEDCQDQEHCAVYANCMWCCGITQNIGVCLLASPPGLFCFDECNTFNTSIC